MVFGVFVVDVMWEIGNGEVMQCRSDLETFYVPVFLSSSTMLFPNDIGVGFNTVC